MIWRLTVIGLAVAAAVAPVPPALVEGTYATRFYPALQRLLTSTSNATQLALFDVVCLGALLLPIGLTLRDVARRHVMGWFRVGLRAVSRTLVLASCLYLAFLICWGFNYRRVPLAEKLAFDPGRAGADEAAALARVAVDRVNRLYETAHQAPVREWEVDPRLADAFEAAQQTLGASRLAVPARPKRTLLDPYFRTAGVDGMTAPFFAETLVPSDLLPAERPIIVAHEWSHLAGYADEGEAGFVAWITCLSGPPAAQYSAWLSIYGDAVRVLPREERQRIAERLASGPVADLQALAERRRRNVQPRIAQAGWNAYDRYLRANRVESGAASYGEVLQLVLGTELGRRAWTR